MFREHLLGKICRSAGVVFVVAGLVCSALIIVIALVADMRPAAAQGPAPAIHAEDAFVGLSLAEQVEARMRPIAERVQVAESPAPVAQLPKFGVTARAAPDTPAPHAGDGEMPPGPWFIGLEPLGMQREREAPGFQETTLNRIEPPAAQGASLRFGHLVTPQGLLFGDLGYQRMADETRISLVDVPPFSNSDFDGFSLGLGGQYSVGENVLMQADFTFRLQEESGLGGLDYQSDGSILRFGLAYTF